ncbi:MAG: hypothetical protein SynsKO_20840 [Synoicihabitans sp.]
MEAGKDWEFFIAGPSTDREVEKSLKEAEKEGLNIRSLGAVYDAEKAEFFQSIDGFLFPTTYRNETWGIVVSEALAYGLPSFVSDMPGPRDQVLPDFVWSDKGGFFQFLERHVQRFEKDPKLLEQTRYTIRARFQSDHQHSLDQLDRIVKSLNETT